MFETILNFFRIQEIRSKIFFTLAMLIVFKIGTFIPVPGVDPSVFDMGSGQGGVLDLMNTFGGGALMNFSVFAMGIMPYITASIVVQLLQLDVVPKFAEWARQGEVGRRKLTQFTRYFTIVLAFIQSIGMSYAFNQMFDGMLIEDNNVGAYLIIAIVLTTGTAFLMWLGEQITTHGVGNGISIIITAGILAMMPNAILQYYQQRFVGTDDITMAVLELLGLIVFVLLLTAFVVFILQAVRKIPVQYAKRQSVGKGLAPKSTYLPLKVNPAGVIPVIFAMAFFMMPQTLTLLFPDAEIAQTISRFADPSDSIGIIFYVALIIAFTYFYSFVQVNPEKMADNLRNQGSYIPGIRPGKSTQTYITSVLYRLVFVGSIFLAFVAILPIFIGGLLDLPPALQIGGTSLLIVVGVVLNTFVSLQGTVEQKAYRGFTKRG